MELKTDRCGAGLPADHAVEGCIWVAATAEGSLAPYLFIESTDAQQSLRGITVHYSSPGPGVAKRPADLQLLQGAVPWRAHDGADRLLLAPSLEGAHEFEHSNSLSNWSLPASVQAIVLLLDPRTAFPRHPALAFRRSHNRTLEWATRSALPIVVAVLTHGRGDFSETRLRSDYQIPFWAVFLVGPAPSRAALAGESSSRKSAGDLAGLLGVGEARFDCDYAARILSAVDHLLGEP